MTGRDGGFALLAVVMGLALLATIAAALTIVSRTSIMAANALVGSSEAELIVDAGIAIAIEYLVDGLPPEIPSADLQVFRSPVRCRLDDAVLRIRIADEAGKVDINAASAELLAALFRGFDGNESRTMDRIAAVADSIDPDDIDRITGRSEREKSSSLGLPPPRNEPFATIDELDQVAGFGADPHTGDVFLDRIRPYITVLSRHSGIDPRVAPPGLPIILANGGLGNVFPDSGEWNAQRLSEVSSGTVPAHFVAPSEARFFSVRVDAVTAAGYRFSREIAIERNPLRKGGHGILGSWIRSATREKTTMLSEVLPCPAALRRSKGVSVYLWARRRGMMSSVH